MSQRPHLDGLAVDAVSDCVGVAHADACELQALPLHLQLLHRPRHTHANLRVCTQPKQLPAQKGLFGAMKHPLALHKGTDTPVL